MKNFLSSTKGKIIAGAVTLAVIAAAVVTVILLNTGYRNIRVEDLNGASKVTSVNGVIDAFKGQNLKSGEKVEVFEHSFLALALDSDKHVIANELTKFRLEATGISGKDSRTVIRLETGSITNEIDNKLLPSESYVVESPNALMSVRGTIFSVTVFFDADGLCHTVIEVSDGVVEVTEKDKNGEITDRTRLLNAGEKAEVVSGGDENNSENPPVTNAESSPSSDNGTTTSSTNSEPPEYPEYHENVMRDPDTIAVEQAIEAYLNGGALDTTNFDRITRLDLYGNSVFAILDGYRYGRGYEAATLDYSTVIKVKFFNEYGNVVIEEDLTYNSMTDLSALKEMKNLESLSLEYGNLTTLSGIETIGKLKSLKIGRTELSDISAVSGLSNLEYLQLDSNRISDITPLSNMTGVEMIYLSDNSISDISPLANLTGLESLNLNDNSISDISPLSGLTKLNYLHLRNNNITDYSPVYGLPLTYLEVSGLSEAEIDNLQQKFPEARIYIQSE